MDAEYNDITRWKYTEVPSAFGATPENVKTYVVKTKDCLEKLLTNEEFNKAKGLQFVELWMPKKDAPRALKITAEISAKTNAMME
jgi:pyruvate decarboxylase